MMNYPNPLFQALLRKFGSEDKVVDQVIQVRLNSGSIEDNDNIAEMVNGLCDRGGFARPPEGEEVSNIHFWRLLSVLDIPMKESKFQEFVKYRSTAKGRWEIINSKIKHLRYHRDEYEKELQALADKERRAWQEYQEEEKNEG